MNSVFTIFHIEPENKSFTESGLFFVAIPHVNKKARDNCTSLSLSQTMNIATSWKSPEFRLKRYTVEHKFKERNNDTKRAILSKQKKEWICSLFKEWILEKSEIRVNICYSLILEWPQGSLGIPEWSLRSLQNEWITNVHSKFTLISLFSKIHSLKSEHIHSFLFREYWKFGHIVTLPIDGKTYRKLSLRGN